MPAPTAPGPHSRKVYRVYIVLALCLAGGGLHQAAGSAIQIACNLAGAETALDGRVRAPSRDPEDGASSGLSLHRAEVRSRGGTRRVWFAAGDDDRPRGTRVLAWPRDEPSVAAEPMPRWALVFPALRLAVSLGVFGLGVVWILRSARALAVTRGPARGAFSMRVEQVSEVPARLIARGRIEKGSARPGDTVAFISASGERVECEIEHIEGSGTGILDSADASTGMVSLMLAGMSRMDLRPGMRLQD